MTSTAVMNLLVDSRFDAIPSSVSVVTTSPATAIQGELVPFYAASVADEIRYSHLVGKVLSARPAPSGDGWIAQVPGSNSDLARVYGTVVNPEFENGKTYLVRDAWIVRYNDEDHRGDRHRPDSAYSILARHNGDPWLVDGDAVGGLLESSAWIEVTYSATPAGVSDVGQSETEVETIPVEDNVVGRPFQGVAKVEENGTILKNPERVFNEMYAVVINTARYPYLATWIPNDELGEFLFHGYVSPYGSGLDFDMTQRNPIGSDTDVSLTWAKLALKRPEPIEDETGRAASLRAEIRNLENSFNAFNEALNEMADNRGHCSDYDEIIEKLGMETRTREWNVEVSVEVTFTDSSPSSRVDSEIGSAYGIDISTTELRIEGKVNVTVTVTAGSEQGARDAVDSNEIEDRLDSLGDLEITDWEITDVNKAD